MPDNNQQGPKTQEHRKQQINHGEDSQNWADPKDGIENRAPDGAELSHPERRQTDAPTGISRQGMNQESRHNKHQ